MKYVLILLLISPIFSYADKQKNNDECVYMDEIRKRCLNRDEFEKMMRAACARQSGNAKNEYSAKLIYTNCLDEAGVKK